MDVGKEFVKIVPVFLFLILIGVIGYSFMAMPDSKPSASVSFNSKFQPSQQVQQCENGESKTCMSGTCQGTSECAGGKWTMCYVKKICIPDTNSSCGDSGCADGYKVCNECGTGYGPCNPK